MTPVTVPVLDRLIDEFPPRKSDPGLSRAESVRILRNAVRRDLEWLLNTKRTPVDPPETLRQLHRSLYVYGLADFSNITLASPKDQAKLMRSLQATVTIFEPRLINVRTVAGELSGAGLRVLRFRIEGMLVMDPTPEPVSFDTVLELTTGEYRVKGDSYAG